MTLPLLADTELVTATWLAEVFGNSNMVGTTLPEDNTTWAASGFVTVLAVGGSTNVQTQMISPLVYIDCWATHPSSNKPPWGKANNLAETIRRAAERARPHKLTLPGQYPKAQFFSVFHISEPRRMADLASYARYNFSMNFNWAQVT